MRHSLKIGIVLLCIMTISLAFALSRLDKEHTTRTKKEIMSERETPYRPALLQNSVLFVEDPGDTLGFGPPTHPDLVWDSVLTEILGADNYGWFGPTTAASEDGPDLATMQMYELVIWNTYDDWGPTDTAALTDPDMTNLAEYFAGGGKVWLIGQDLIYSGVPEVWLQTYFHLDSANQDYNDGDTMINLQGLVEIAGYSITAFDDLFYVYYADELFPDTSVTCHTVLHDPDSVKDVGIFYPGFGEWQSAFWTADGRVQPSAADWSEWVGMVTGMLDAFGIVPGVEETPYRKSAHELMLIVRPVPVVQTAVISFAIPIADNVKLEVFNTLGQRVVTLMDEYKRAGSYNVNWNGRDTKGVDVANGIYIVRLTYADVSRTATIVVVE